MKELLLSKTPAATCAEFDSLRFNLCLGETDATGFIDAFLEWFNQDELNQITGLESFNYRYTCFGVTHFIDSLISKHGEHGLQILEHDYFYYRRLWPAKQWTRAGSLIPGQPLLMALPFPGYGSIHPSMGEILTEAIEKTIPIHLDCAWLPAARGIEFDLSHPAVSSLAISLSKGLGLDWNRIGVVFTRKKDDTDPITIANMFGMVNSACLDIGVKYMERFHFNHLWRKYGEAYDRSCRELRLRPTNVIHMMRELGSGKPVGTRDLLLALSH